MPFRRKPDDDPISTSPPTPVGSLGIITQRFARSVDRERVNGLAGICALVLVTSGLGLPIPGGHLAADAILVVAGFQIGLDVRRLAGTDAWLRRYWLCAVGPIVLPTLVAVALATGSWWWLDRLDPAAARGATGAAMMVPNLVPLVGDASFPATEHLWLIGLIVQFGLLAPLAVVLARRPGSGRTVLRFSLAAAAILAVARLLLAVTDTIDPATLAQATSTRVDGLLVGAGVALAPTAMLRRVPGTVATPALVALLALFALSPDPDTNPTVALGVLAPLVVAATAAILVTQTSLNPNLAVRRVLGHLGPRWLGERALGTYIWHRLFGMALADQAAGAGAVFVPDWPGLEPFVVRLVFALAAGAATYRYLQVPLRAMATRTDRQADGTMAQAGPVAWSA